MAVAGAMTTAYKLMPSAGPRPRIDKTTFPSGLCTPPADAVAQLRNWTADSEPVIVQGSDMAEFWQKWNEVQ